MSQLGVPTRSFTPQKHTITKHVHIHFRTLHGWFAINDQWSIQFLIHWNEIKWICTMNILSPQFTATQHKKWAWTASHPTQRPLQLPSTVSTLPTSSVGAGFSGSSVFPSLVSSSRIWSRCRVNKRKVGGATGPQVGERVNAQPMLDDGGEGFCGCDTILILIFSL